MWVPNARPAQVFEAKGWTVTRTRTGWQAVRRGTTERLEAPTLPALAAKLRAHGLEKISNSA